LILRCHKLVSGDVKQSVAQMLEAAERRIQTMARKPAITKGAMHVTLDLSRGKVMALFPAQYFGPFPTSGIGSE